MTAELLQLVPLHATDAWRSEARIRRDCEADVRFPNDDIFWLTMDELVVQGVLERGRNHAHKRVYRLTEAGLQRREHLLIAARRGRLFQDA